VDYAVDGVPNVFGRAVGVGLADVKPGDDDLQGDYGGIDLGGGAFGRALDPPKCFLDASVHLASSWHKHLGRSVGD
jgi:hypothetical protein